MDTTKVSASTGATSITTLGPSSINLSCIRQTSFIVGPISNSRRSRRGMGYNLWVVLQGRATLVMLVRPSQSHRSTCSVRDVQYGRIYALLKGKSCKLQGSMTSLLLLDGLNQSIGPHRRLFSAISIASLGPSSLSFSIILQIWFIVGPINDSRLFRSNMRIRIALLISLSLLSSLCFFSCSSITHCDLLHKKGLPVLVHQDRAWEPHLGLGLVLTIDDHTHRDTTQNAELPHLLEKALLSLVVYMWPSLTGHHGQ
ncbi:hypothetical protein CRG98_031428 [Punica granatum]|uniref:Uncharacterized protein n=1 Tax=Punica granatum TaxID=22663 RepID=A0A2I0IWN3_PUNGR|nr:hypothetical protein CRG98_031428 [Punica granatum]